MTAVADAGPLIILNKLGILDLLPQLYDRVLVPSPVYDEAVIRGATAGHSDADALQTAVLRGVLAVIQMNDDDLAPRMRSLALGTGETFAIQLALRKSPDWILLDDLLARTAARGLGFKIKGTVGITVDAYRNGLLSRELRDFIFESLITRDDIWISEALVRRVWAELRHDDE